MKLEVGDIVLVKPKGLLARIISFLTKSNYSHAAMVFDDEVGLIMDTNWAAANISAIKIYDDRGYDVYRVIHGLSANDKMELKKWMIDNLGTPYDYVQLLSFSKRFILGIKKVINIPDKYVCSELVDRAYQSIEIDLVPEFSVGDVTPEDVKNSKLLMKIKE